MNRAKADNERLRNLADNLADAIRSHRADMHRESDRPCSTCSKSKAALNAYEKERATWRP